MKFPTIHRWFMRTVLLTGLLLSITPVALAQGPTSATPFATYKEPAVGGSPQVSQPPIAPDLSNVEIPFVLTEPQRKQLAEGGFVVSPGVDKEFFTLYEQGRYNYQPLFVTSGSLLHVYHLMFDKILRTVESKQFTHLLRELTAAAIAQAEIDYNALVGTPSEDAALRTWAYFVVAGKLLDDRAVVPSAVADLVDVELRNIGAAAGVEPSPVFPGLEFGEDYTQYTPRGHYTKTDVLQRYFRAMMWYGRMTFRLTTKDPEVGQAETRMALLVADIIRTIKVGKLSGLEAWNDLYAPTGFFVGKSDDLTIPQYLAVMDEVYGPHGDLTALADDAKLADFIARADKLPAPKILGLVILYKSDVEETTKGLRFMGQRFVPDAYIFRQLVYRNVGTAQKRRGLPSGLDVFAALGSERAYDLLERLGETEYAKYPEQMNQIREIMAGYSQEQWTETLYNTWMYGLKTLIDAPGSPLAAKDISGYPQFMQSQDWLDRSLNTALGSWAELKHDTLLYAKQVYAEMGGGGPKGPPPSPVEPKGYVEPNPLLFARLAGLTALTREGLASRNLLSKTDGDNLTKVESLALAFKTMAEKELRNEALTAEEYDAIRFYGGDLEHITIAASLDDVDEAAGPPVMDEEPRAAIIADVATDPDHDFNGVPDPVVLEVGIGPVDPIYVVAPIEGKLQVVMGGDFSYYEFAQPARDRLTDGKWRELLDAGRAPARQPWTASFVVTDTVNEDLALAVRRFNDVYVSSIWWPGAWNLERVATGDGSNWILAEVDALNSAGEYEGRQLIQFNFRSFDLQSPDVAVVTARETWDAKLYKQGPDGSAGPLLKQRGPYTIDTTYTLQRTPTEAGTNWLIGRVVWNTQPPEWQSAH
jgi:hypothetical protein